MTNTSFQFAKATLQSNQISQFFELQTRVRDSLSRETRHYIKERSAERIHAHLAENMPILTLSDTNRLIGSVMLTYPENTHADHLDGYPFQTIGPEESIAVIQSLYVDPDYRGQSLSSRLLKCASDFAMTHGRINLVAKVAACNEKSQRSFTQNAFEIYAQGHDPAKGYAVTYLLGDALKVHHFIKQKRNCACKRILPLARIS